MESEITQTSEAYLFAEAALGMDVQAFLKTKTGRYLHGRAKEVVGSYLRAVLDQRTPPEELEALKQESIAAKTAMDWLAEALQNGQQAEQQLRQLED